jgi:hypothetical protein
MRGSTRWSGLLTVRRPGRRPARRFVCVAIPTCALALVLVFGMAGNARASHWTDVPFPSGQTALDIAEDSDGNI